MGIQKSFKFVLCGRDLIPCRIDLPGNGLDRIFLLLGQLSEHRLETLVRQSDAAKSGLNLRSKIFFTHIRLGAWAPFFGAAVVMVLFLALCRDGTTAVGASGQAKEREKNLSTCMRPAFVLHLLLDAIE
jgi:hypothetical protein